MTQRFLAVLEGARDKESILITILWRRVNLPNSMECTRQLSCAVKDYCNALLTGLPACVVKPLQMIQNAAARLVFNQPKRAHVTPLLIELYWLPVAARIKFKSLMLAYRVLSSAPTYLNALVRANVTPRTLHSVGKHK